MSLRTLLLRPNSPDVRRIRRPSQSASAASRSRSLQGAGGVSCSWHANMTRKRQGLQHVDSHKWAGRCCDSPEMICLFHRSCTLNHFNSHGSDLMVLIIRMFKSLAVWQIVSQTDRFCANFLSKTLAVLFHRSAEQNIQNVIRAITWLPTQL